MTSFLFFIAGYSAPTSPCPDVNAAGETICDGPDSSNPITREKHESESSETKVSFLILVEKKSFVDFIDAFASIKKGHNIAFSALFVCDR